MTCAPRPAVDGEVVIYVRRENAPRLQAVVGMGHLPKLPL